MRSDKMCRGPAPRGRKLRRRAAAVVVALLLGPAALAALADEEGGEVSGSFAYAAQLPGVCGISAVVCATGSFSGSIQGTFTNAITSLLPSALVQEMVDFYTGSITINSGHGQLMCDLAGALQDSGDGEFGEICVVTGGSGGYTGATGYLELTGQSVTSGLPVFGLHGAGNYHGKLVTPKG